MRYKQPIAIVLLLMLCVFIVRLFVIDVVVVDETQTWRVYFASEEDVILLPEIRLGNPTLNDRLQALVNGPRQSGLNPIFPEGTMVINYWLEGDILYVNLSQDVVDNHPGGSSAELITVYGLVNTMTEDPQVARVQILVEGQRLSTIAGHVDIQHPLARDETLIGELM